MREIPENPFCSRRIRPGAIPYHFPEGRSLDALVEDLKAHDWRGQIIGPHGSGKSTLLAALLPVLGRQGRRLIHMELEEGERWLPLGPEELLLLGKDTVLAIDGYEQLSYWSRRWLKRKSITLGFGLIIIAHVPYDLPDLYRTRSDLSLAKLVVGILLDGSPVKIPDSQIEEHYTASHGNIREMLFSLYDVYELEQRKLMDKEK